MSRAEPDEPPSETAFDRAATASQRRLAEADRKAAAAFLRSTYRDELTGALHRRPGRQQMQAALRRAQQRSTSLCVAFLDVDNLKAVNDREGHPSGDRMLAAMGQALHSSLRGEDVIVRYGGDEFVCAMVSVSRDEAMAVIERVAETLDRLYPGAQLSAGSAYFAAGDTLDDLIGRADADLYRRRNRRRATDRQLSVQGGPIADARPGSVACGACGERIGLADFVLLGGRNMARAADCGGCGETTVISLA